MSARGLAGKVPTVGTVQRERRERREWGDGTVPTTRATGTSCVSEALRQRISGEDDVDAGMNICLQGSASSGLAPACKSHCPSATMQAPGAVQRKLFSSERKCRETRASNPLTCITVWQCKTD